MLLVASLCLYKRSIQRVIPKCLFFILAFSSVVLFVAYGAAYYFTGTGIDDATFYHLKYGLGGAGFLEYRRLIGLSAAILLSGFLVLFWLVFRVPEKRVYSWRSSCLSFLFMVLSLGVNPASIDIYTLQKSYVVPAAQAGTIALGDFKDYYKEPHISQTEKKQKNFVFIYAESLERSYFDETFFPGLIKGLKQLESKSTYFPNIYQAAMTEWTVGGITSSLCGIPLFTPSEGNSMAGMDQFLSSAVCLGDLLNDEGYHLAYMGGAYLKFAGKGKLFESHGFSSVEGQDELLPQLEDQSYMTFWGLHDDSLFELVYNRFVKLSKTGEKFGLFTLTLNTHHPNGHISKDCGDIQYQSGSNPILNAVACSDFLITKFINQIIESPYADETVIVLVSDHLSMRNTAYPYLQQTSRRNLFMIVEPGVEESVEVRTSGSTLDIGSTLLPFIGYTGEIGLGRNLLDGSRKTQEEINFINGSIMRWAKPLAEFWDFPSIEESLEIRPEKQSVRIDNRTFQAPLLIEVNSQLQTTMKFQRKGVKGEHSLVSYRNEIDPGQAFLLIDECESVKQLDNTLNGEGFCLLVGQGKKYTTISQLDKNITYSADELRQLLNLPLQR